MTDCRLEIAFIEYLTWLFILWCVYLVPSPAGFCVGSTTVNTMDDQTYGRVYPNTYIYVYTASLP